jgi:hypothetical protein
MSGRLLIFAVCLLLSVVLHPLPIASADNNTAQNPPLLTQPADPAQGSSDCVCNGAFHVGERVTLIVNAPDDKTDLHAGSTGTVICGDEPLPSLLVSWDGLTSGHNGNGGCVCPVSSAPDSTGWWVECADVVPLQAPAPAMSHIGLVVMMCLLLGVALVMIARSRAASAR